MSSDTPPSHRRDRGRGEPEPMLVLGENRPEVEDSTPEQLRRQQEELRREVERQRRQAQERIERERAEHRELLEQQRRRHEEELRRRQDQLDDAQRRLHRESSTLRRRMTPSEATLLPQLSKVPDVPLHRSWWKLLLLAIASVALVVAGMTAAQPGGREADEATETFLATDEARTAWTRTALALDQTVTTQLAGDDAGPLAERTTRLAETAASYDTDYADLYRDDVSEISLAVGDGVSEVRTLAIWQDIRPSATYAVSMTEVREAREAAVSPEDSAVWAGLGALLVLALLLVRARRSERVAEMGLFTAALVPALLLVAYATFVRPSAAVEIHETSLTGAQSVSDQTDRDLRIAYGLRPPVDTDTFWTGPQQLDRLPAGPEVDAVLAARADLGRQIETADPQKVYPAAATLTNTTADLFEREAARTAQAADSLAREVRSASPVTGLVLAGLSILCAAGAVVLSAVKKS